MVDMKTNNDLKGEDTVAVKPTVEYDYGLRINLTSDSLKKLGIKELPKIKSKMKMMAVVEVCETSANESSIYGDNSSMVLQICEMELKDGTSKEE